MLVTGNDSQLGLMRVCTFHPSYGYEDFMEGYRPQVGTDGSLVFERRDGIFKRLCANAAMQPDRKFYLVIDEINRGDIPRIFGELLTLLEKDKRGQAIYLPYSDNRFTVPENVFVIGTMNTPAPYACVPVLLLFDAGPWVWLAWLTLPVALALSRSVLLGAVGRELNPVLKLTAQLHLAFGALLALGLLL